MVLVSLTYAAAAVRMSRRGVLAQQLNAIESLASVDTICIDKTGTLTEPRCASSSCVPAPGVDRSRLAPRARDARRERVGAQRHAAGDRRRVPGASRAGALGEVPFSSRRRWSAVQVADGSVYLGAPGRMPRRRPR